MTHVDLSTIVTVEKDIAEALSKYQEMTKSLSDALSKYIESMRPLTDAFADYKSRMHEAVLSMQRTVRPFDAISAIAQTQYVLWEYITSEFVDRILDAVDVNQELLAYEGENSFHKSNEIISLCANHPYLVPSQRVFTQSITAYQNGYYDLAVISLTTVIDSVLSQASRMNTHKPAPRVEAILEKLKESESISDSEYAEISLYSTFRSTSLSFYKFAPFDEDEPENLNRHWIIHGRSKREKTQLDCIKLIHFLYGIILLEQ